VDAHFKFHNYHYSRSDKHSSLPKLKPIYNICIDRSRHDVSRLDFTVLSMNVESGRKAAAAASASAVFVLRVCDRKSNVFDCPYVAYVETTPTEVVVLRSDN
jgi:hypothetical protein